jgi:hypothetical protein
MKAIAISPIVIKVIPGPFKGPGTGDLSTFFLIAAKDAIANHQPSPEPNPNITD